MSDRSGDRQSWTFLTNHARVLVVIARDPDVRLRDVASACGITERTVQAIVADLENAGYLTHAREGRRNRYRLAPGKRFRHPLEGDYEITGLLDLLKAAPGDGAQGRGTRLSDVRRASYAGAADAAPVVDADAGATDPSPGRGSGDAAPMADAGLGDAAPLSRPGEVDPGAEDRPGSAAPGAEPSTGTSAAGPPPGLDS
ncbi:helix-turn-helix transcriptional regulator [Streptomyces sp. NBC_00691]|uniref:helix-turn-helix transcriptional regulator n=1 Tax=Streptomyces sp. NBC_00691 TaxID=2903671 RepID=UPI003FA7979E